MARILATEARTMPSLPLNTFSSRRGLASTQSKYSLAAAHNSSGDAKIGARPWEERASQNLLPGRKRPVS